MDYDALKRDGVKKQKDLFQGYVKMCRGYVYIL